MIVKLFLVLFLFTTSCTVSPRYGASNQVNNKKNIKNNRIKSNGVLRGVSSWYGPNFHGKLTANGEVYDMYGVTAAHKTLTLNTVVRVTNLDNDKSIILRINDRGPYVKGRVIDLSYKAAQKLGFVNQGTTKVRIEVLRLGDNKYHK